IRACVQPFDSLFHEAPRSEHQNRSIDFGVSELAAYMDSAQSRQTNVEQNTVVRRMRSHSKGLLTGVREIDSIRVLAQCPANKTCHPPFVFDKKDSHSRIIRLTI